MQSANLSLKALADRMLAFKRDNGYTFVHFNPVGADPQEIVTRLRASTMADLVLPEGDSLSIPNGGDYYPDLGITAQDARVTRVSLTAMGWDWERYAQYPDSPVWGRHIEVSLWYGRGRREDPLVKQVFSSQSYDRKGLPSLARDVWADAYFETGYEGHNQKYREARSAAEARFFIDLVAELFALTPEGQP